jgi:3-hydroxymyristoyl/3-hydroxydecanoyl-(acyl carrier protein) dehydratase
VAQARRNVFKFNGTAEVDGVVVADATFAATIAPE